MPISLPPLPVIGSLFYRWDEFGCVLKFIEYDVLSGEGADKAVRVVFCGSHDTFVVEGEVLHVALAGDEFG